MEEICIPFPLFAIPESGTQGRKLNILCQFFQLRNILQPPLAYGSKGDKIKDKKFALAISAGIKEQDYTPDGRYKVTVEELTIPFATTFRYTKSDYRPFFAFYGAEDIPEDQTIDQRAVDYLKFARAL